jgi:hypothetical protein
MRRTQWVVDFDELRHNPDLYQNLTLPSFVTARKELRLAVPLLQQDRTIGIAMLERPPEPFELTYEDRDLLKTVGRMKKPVLLKRGMAATINDMLLSARHPGRRQETGRAPRSESRPRKASPPSRLHRCRFAGW